MSVVDESVEAQQRKNDAPLGGGDAEHSHDNELNRTVAKQTSKLCLLHNCHLNQRNITKIGVPN